MKICIIAPVVIPILGREQKYGGIEIVVSIAADEMVRRGHEVLLFASGDSKTTAKLMPTTPKALGQGVSFDKEKECNRKAYEMAVAEKPDVIWDNTLGVHAQEMRENRSKFLFQADIVLKKDELYNTGEIPVVQTLHGPAKDHLPGLIRALSESGNYFVSISKDQARRYLEIIPDLRHLGTVYNAVDTDFYRPVKKKEGDYLLWVGRYCMEKGPHIALEVAHQIGFPMKLIGKKVEKHELDYFDLFIKPNLKETDEVLDSGTPADEKVNYYANAKATMMTNLWPEPFGLVVAESMACGTPVVGPALGSLTELIDQAGILVPIDDLGLDENEQEVTASQKKYIDRIVEYMRKLDKIPSEVSRKRAEFLFSPKHNVDGYEEAFYKAMYLKEEETNRSLIE
jgi:glycosyltransferase involved in cell wall biosynthesis